MAWCEMVCEEFCDQFTDVLFIIYYKETQMHVAPLHKTAVLTDLKRYAAPGGKPHIIRYEFH